MNGSKSVVSERWGKGLCQLLAGLCTERFLSPAFVLAIHAGLVAEVMLHRPELWTDTDAWGRGVRCLVAMTILVYMSTCITDPGWLPGRPSPCVPICCALPFALGLKGEELRRLSDPAAPQIAAVEMKAASGSDGEREDDVRGTKSIQKRRGASPMDEETGDASAVNLRWCKQCSLLQPIRTKHCHDCGCCVRTHDHHCPWIGSCVGERNRCFFLAFLLLQASELAIFFREGVLGISILEPSVVLLVALLFIAMFFLMVACLCLFHIFLALANLTTWEHSSWNRITYLKDWQSSRGSPFGKSMAWNLSVYCCGPSWCLPALRRLPGLRYDEEGGIVWEMAEPPAQCCLVHCCNEMC